MKSLNYHKTNWVDKSLDQLKKETNDIGKNQYKNPWKSAYSDKERSEFIKYLLNDPQHRNDADRYYWVAIRGYAGQLIAYRNSAIQAYYALGKLMRQGRLNKNYMFPEYSKWILGKWIMNDSIECNFTLDRKVENSKIPSKMSYTSLVGYTNEDKGFAGLTFLGRNNFIYLEENSFVFLRNVNKINKNQFTIITPKGDTITYTRVLDKQ